jgi:hypothetical protein
MDTWRRTMLRSLFGWWILKRRGSVSRRLWRMTMCWRMMMRSLFSWLILRDSVRRRLRRIIMWRRMMLRRIMLKRLCR